jgi:hypothetical protein
MSGITADNPYRASGVIAAAAAGGLSWQDIVTASTLTAEAGNAYWIDTTSNACTITLPSSADNGDEIIFADYARTWATNAITLDSNGLNYQGQTDESTVEYGTDGQAVHIVYSGATNGWIPILDKAVALTAAPPGNSEGIFAYGETVSMSNLVSNAGVVSTDVTGVGTARGNVSGCEYGGDKGIFGYGGADSPTYSLTNLVSNTGVVSTDVTGVGTIRYGQASCSYGTEGVDRKGIFGYGNSDGTAAESVTNLVSNTGVVSTDVTGVGSARWYIAACEYGDDKGIFGYGHNPSLGGAVSMTNLVSNTGVASTDVTGVGTARNDLAACSFGGDKGIFGSTGSNVTNLVSNTGVVATDVAGVGTARSNAAGCEYGGTKGIFGYGGGPVSVTNLVSTVGVVSADVTGVGTARNNLGGCSFN